MHFKKLQFKSIASATFILLSGCGTAPIATSQLPTTATSNNAIADGARICIITPPDAKSKEEVHINSGVEIASRTAQAVERINGFLTETAPANSSLESCRERGTEFAIRIQILHYEDNFTGWSGKPDRISIRLLLQRTIGNESPTIATYSAKSDTIASAFIEWGNAKPYQLLKDEYEATVQNLIESSRIIP
jgi:hypothetical protein